MLVYEPGCPPSMSEGAADDNDDLGSRYDLDLDDTDAGGDPDNAELRDDVISIISSKSTKSKKRVQFFPDGNGDGMLCRVREIPPRSNKSSSDSDDDSESDSDDDSGTDLESASDRDTPSPATKTVSDTNFTTMPPLVYNATSHDKPISSSSEISPDKPTKKSPERSSSILPQTDITSSSGAKGSYAVSKTNSNRNTSVVAKITGIHHRPISPSVSIVTKTPNRKLRRVPSPRLDKRPKKPQYKQHEKPTSPDENNNNNKKQKPVRRNRLKKDGKQSPPPPPKQTKCPPAARHAAPLKLSSGLPQRRVSSAPLHKLGPNRLSQATSISTSLTTLPLHPAAPPMDPSVNRVERAMQSLNLGSLYTIDGFIFPTHQVSTNLHLPDLPNSAKSEEDFFFVNGRRGSQDPASSLARQDSSSALHSPRREVFQGSKAQLSPTSANRKRRYAWQMANGSISGALNTTPGITQMWDTEPAVTSSAHNHMTSLQSSHKPYSHNGMTGSYSSSSVSASYDSNLVGRPGLGNYHRSKS